MGGGRNRAADGVGLATALTGMVQERLQVREVRDIVPLVHGAALDRPALARAPLVIDPAATDRRRDDHRGTGRGAGEDGEVAAATRLGLAASPLALAGGLVMSSEVVGAAC
ncbi:MAG: hypothetical protein U0797_26160 [Gemmataceae bacterium]